MGDINRHAEKIHATATKSGFWPTDREDALSAVDRLNLMQFTQPNEDMAVIRRYIEAQEVRNMGEMLMLAVSELAEGLEEHRDEHPSIWYKAIMSPSRPTMEGWPEQAKIAYDKLGGHVDSADISREDHRALVNVGVIKPEGLAVELADCIIRCLDTMASLDVNIEEVIVEKMAYNDSRKFKHGRKY